MTIDESPEGKDCKKCGDWKVFAEYYWVKAKNRHHSYCKDCVRSRNREEYNKNIDTRREWQRSYYQRLKKKVYDAYGSKCNCCGELNELFLTIDHVNNDGADHRREYGNNGRSQPGVSGGGAGIQIYHLIVKEKFPDRYQILCYNCNCGKARNGGICPHVG